MNSYEQLVPQLLAAGVVLAIAVRVIWQARRDREANRFAFERRMTELADQHAASLKALGEPSALRLTLDWDDPDTVADVARVARDTEPLVSGVNRYAASVGEPPFLVTGATAERGRVVLTLTRPGAGGAGAIRHLADALNAAFDHAPPPGGGPVPDLGPLPPAVSGAHAAVAFTG